MTRVLLVDDHPMIAAALEMLLRETDYELLERARTVAEAVKQIAKLKPDLLLLDVHLPDGSGLDLLRKLSLGRARLKVILLTAGMDDSQLLSAQDLRPEGMVLKTSDPGLLLECMDAVVSGQPWIDPEIVERTNQAQERAASAPPLTRRERELVELVRQGLRNRDIAAELGVTEGTVKVYLHAIFDKFKVDNRTELALRAAELVKR
ncbi:response regulator transcription factor [Sphingomonas flavescens]|uniref:response regulator transcription factor n=1 Tax=Sphingomonas flavescens TaxID=3132797 RepID=UPI0028061DEC|nr:response regulator transcription factor [Sphingomonas limnosediminicola]